MSTGRPFTAFLIAGEESGDQLGAGLMGALREKLGADVQFLGVGGERMAQSGLASLFPMEEIAHHGVLPVVANLHKILGRMREAAKAAVAADPDVLVLIDCPGFNQGVGRRVRKWRPSIPIVHYVSPSVWVWRPDRARKMARFVDRLLAILPFEPAVHRKLGGPQCEYVGHPLIERLDRLRPGPGERAPLGLNGTRPIFLVLPGSRSGEVKRLTKTFGETVARVVREAGPMDVVLPAVSRLAGELKERTATWPVRPIIVEGEVEKYAAFRRAHVALAASGTVSLELALSGVPMVVAYRVDPLVKPFKHVLSRIHSFVLANLVLGTNDIPEFLDEQTTPERMAAALVPLFRDSPERQRQLAAFARMDDLMAIKAGSPSRLAADIVLATVDEHRLQKGPSQRRLETGT